MDKIIVNFVGIKSFRDMNLLEKKEYIYSHLHQLDEDILNEMYNKMFSLIESEDPVIGYDVQTGEALTKKSYKSEMERRNAEIDAGDYLLHEDVKKESKNW